MLLHTGKLGLNKRIVNYRRWGMLLGFALAPLPALAWQALGSGVNSTVLALSLNASGDLYAGGAFTTAGGNPANRIAKWDGSTWSALGSGMDNTITALSTDASGKLYAGGDFTTAGDNPASHIAQWDGTAWSALGSGMDSTIQTLSNDTSGNLYAGGRFTTAGGNSANNIAQWNGSAWSALGSGVSHNVYALSTAPNGTLYAGGAFITGGGLIAKWDGNAWSALGTGMDNIVLALTLDAGGKLYAGGFFTTAGGNPANNIAQWNGTAWSALGSGMNHIFGNRVSALLTDASGKLYAGGSFTTAGSNPAKFIAKWDGSAWSALGGGLSNSSYALDIDASGNLYAGGSFNGAGTYGFLSAISANSIAVYVSQALTANQWRMVSLPHVPVSGATLQSTSLFGDNLTPANYDSTWVVYERNEATKAYRKLSITDPLVQGKGYWIQSTSNATLDMDGTATPVVSQTSNPNCTSSKGCYEVTLTSPDAGEASRANLVGFPFFRPASWANVRFQVNGTAYTPSAAETGNFAAKTLWKYNGSSYQTFDDVTLGSIGTLSKMEGFWVKLLPASIGQTVKLLLPLS